jgi:GH43 family beta-xylosidase
MYYAYSSDMKTFDTAPSLLFAPANGDSAIDSDIIYRNGKYYMYYKNETNKRIYLGISDHASGPYTEVKQISEGNMGVEGPNIYNLAGTDRWLLMSDAYGDGYYVMQQTDDLENFTSVNRNDYSFDFTPRHGYVIPITIEQYENLVKTYPSASLTPFSTGTETVKISTGINEKISLPDKTTVSYSDGKEAEYMISWNTEELFKINTAKKGIYTVPGVVQNPGYREPFIEERADPYITYGDDRYYYFTASYPAFENADNGYDRIILRRSSTVSGLAVAEEKTIWKAHSSGILSKHIWAPEMHKINNVWYMFFAAGSSENVWAIRPYVLRCTGSDPYNDGWTECGQMQASYGDNESFTGFSLDMTYFEHNGKHYVIWAEIKGDSSLFMAQIDPREPWKLSSKPVMLTKPEYDWEKVNNRVNEGAAVLKTDSKVYVFFSASGTGSEYCVGRLEADIDSDLMDISSWKKITTPVLQTNDLNGPTGPGHNSFVTDENGDLLLVYHARPESHDSKQCGSYCSEPLYDPCRHTRIKKVFFDNNGVPVINMNSQKELASAHRTVTAIIEIK